MEISNRRASANGFFIQGQINHAFKTLISIKQSVIQSFKDSERDKLKEIEEKFTKISSFLSFAASNSLNPQTRNASALARELANKYYPEYNDLLMDLLNKYGYLVGQQKDASRMKF